MLRSEYQNRAPQKAYSHSSTWYERRFNKKAHKPQLAGNKKSKIKPRTWTKYLQRLLEQYADRYLKPNRREQTGERKQPAKARQKRKEQNQTITEQMQPAQNMPPQSIVPSGSRRRARWTNTGCRNHGPTPRNTPSRDWSRDDDTSQTYL
jgi:hypothetical protein